MQKRFFYVTLLLLFLTAGPGQSTYATHYVHFGHDVELVCINPCTTRVYFNQYRECTPIAGSVPTAVNLSPLAPGCASPPTVGNPSTAVVTEVTRMCPGMTSTCTNANSPLLGAQQYSVYQDYDICAPGVNCNYTLNWTTCCRTPMITSGSAQEDMALSNEVNVTLGCNNSPIFNTEPVFTICAGQSISISQAATDPDGDSLRYGITACLKTPNTPVTYNPGFSAVAPLGASWGITLDPASGILNIAAQPGNIEVGVVCFSVSEYRNGNLIGVSHREMMIQVLNCNANQAPATTAFSNLSTGATVVNPNLITYCGTGPLCFDVSGFDPDTTSGQTVSLFWDESIVGATFSETGNPAVQDTVTGNSPDASFCWPSPAPGTYSFTLTVEDDFCPFPNRQDQNITLIVGSPASQSNLITPSGVLDTCAGTTVTLTGLGGFSNYLWSNSATTQSIVASTPGTYVLTADNGGPCTYTDSYTVVDQSVAEITGRVSGPSYDLVNQKVYLIRHDASTNGLYAEDSTLTDGLGMFSFCGVSLDTMYIKVAPDSATYPLDMPTYADTAVWWNNAEMILAANFPVSKFFLSRSGGNPGGPGFIGGLISQGANKRQAPGDPMPNVSVLLYSNTLDQFVDVTTSDANGYFFFGSIPLGDYEVSVDVPGVDHVIVPALELNVANQQQDSLDFRLHTTYFELVLPTAIATPGLSDLSMEAFPNPISAGAAAKSMTVRLNLPEDAQVNLKLFDLRGQVVGELEKGQMNSGTHRFDLDFDQANGAGNGLSPGLYFLEMQGISQSYQRVLKIVVIAD